MIRLHKALPLFAILTAILMAWTPSGPYARDELAESPKDDASQLHLAWMRELGG